MNELIQVSLDSRGLEQSSCKHIVYSTHTHQTVNTQTHNVVLTVSNVKNDAAAVRDEQSERVGGMTLQTQTHTKRMHTQTFRCTSANTGMQQKHISEE